MAVTPKAKATSARIAAKAGVLFLQQGYSKTTIADVAAEAGVAVGTVLLHFGSKSALATAAFSEQITTVVEQAVATVPGVDLIGDIAHVVSELYDWYRAHDGVAGALLRESLFSVGESAAVYAEAVGQTVTALEGIVATHLVLAADGEAVGRDVVGEGLLADYLLVLLQGLHGRHQTTDDQVAHFVRLASPRLASLSSPAKKDEATAGG